MKACIFLAVVFFISCKNKESAPIEKIDSSGISIPRTDGLLLEEKLTQADSMEVLFYDDPDGDSLRYTRYFKFTATNDTSIINTLLHAIDTSFEERNEIRPCRSEGKIYLFANEDPLKTIYFSTRPGNCSYLYFIRNGLYCYFDITQELKEKLAKLKEKKKAPKAVTLPI